MKTERPFFSQKNPFFSRYTSVSRSQPGPVPAGRQSQRAMARPTPKTNNRPDRDGPPFTVAKKKIAPRPANFSGPLFAQYAPSCNQAGPENLCQTCSGAQGPPLSS